MLTEALDNPIVGGGMTEIDERQVYEITRPHSKLLLLYVLRCLLTGPGFPFVFLPSYFKYETLKYRFDDEGITMSWGLLWRREIFLTYARIQDIHVSRGLFERWLGLGTINVQTASGSSSAEMAIVGLPQYEMLRDFLYFRMRGARFGQEPKEEQVETPAASDDETLALLTDIRDEIRALRERLGEGGGGVEGGGMSS
ncbi:MAG: PH domain-containing protein [Planctomycetota bacterium]|jgi:putative membrane protein